MSINIDPAIFRDYDIRGIYPDQLNEDTYYILGRAIATYMYVPEIGVGYDMRLSSPSLFRSLTCGIMEQGTDVINLGLISTEMHYFASGHYQMPGNAIISASHNPGNYNGLKIVTKGAVPLHGGFGLPEIKKLAIENNFPILDKKGKMKNLSIIDDWIKHAVSFINPSNLRQLKVVIDAGNGMGGISWQKMQNLLPVEIIPLYFKPDGNFPNHLPDPLKKENSKDLSSEIIRCKADMGFALDGDADRFFAFDEKGKMIPGTVTTAILVADLLGKYGSNPVLYNTVCGKVVPETIEKYKGKAIRVRVGHSFIKETMKKENALFAGEHSGHFYFRDNYFADSSLIAGLIFLEYISKRNLPVSEVVTQFNKYPSSGELNFKVSKPSQIMDSIVPKLKNSPKTDYLDGLSVWYKDWWFNLRSSKTEPYIRLNIEADSLELLELKTVEVTNLISGLGGTKV